MKILLLEDDEILGEIIEEFLLSLDYQVELVTDGHEAQEKLYEEKFDLLLFDVNVPHIDGFTLIKSIREQKILTPAIFITSLHTSKDLEKGFEVGGDDYIKKPFELNELKVRINNIKRIYKIEASTKQEIVEGVFYDSQTLTINNTKISRKESKVLEFLLQRTGEIVSSETILHNVYSYEEAPSDATLRTYIKNLRRAIGADVIETIKGVGYRFNS